MRTYEEIIKELTARNAKVVENVTVTNVTVKDMGSIEKSFVTLHLNKQVEKVVNGKVEKIDSIVISVISMIGILRPTVGSSVAHHIRNVMSSLEDLLDDCTIGKLYQEFAADGTKNDVVTDHDRKHQKDAFIYNYPLDIKLSLDAMKTVKQVKMLRTLGPTIFGFGM